jgi:hypothetical protein
MIDNILKEQDKNPAIYETVPVSDTPQQPHITFPTEEGATTRYVFLPFVSNEQEKLDIVESGSNLEKLATAYTQFNEELKFDFYFTKAYADRETPNGENIQLTAPLRFGRLALDKYKAKLDEYKLTPNINPDPKVITFTVGSDISYYADYATKNDNPNHFELNALPETYMQDGEGLINGAAFILSLIKTENFTDTDPILMGKCLAFQLLAEQSESNPNQKAIEYFKTYLNSPQLILGTNYESRAAFLGLWMDELDGDTSKNAINTDLAKLTANHLLKFIEDNNLTLEDLVKNMNGSVEPSQDRISKFIIESEQKGVLFGSSSVIPADVVNQNSTVFSFAAEIINTEGRSIFITTLNKNSHQENCPIRDCNPLGSGNLTIRYFDPIKKTMYVAADLAEFSYQNLNPNDSNSPMIISSSDIVKAINQTTGQVETIYIKNLYLSITWKPDSASDHIRTETFDGSMTLAASGLNQRQNPDTPRNQAEPNIIQYL